MGLLPKQPFFLNNVRLQEAKQFLNEKDVDSPNSRTAAATTRDPRANAKPKVDLFS